MTEFQLIPHPDFPSVAVTAIGVLVERDDGAFSATYRVTGDLGQVLWPELIVEGGPRRADDLWKHTCFEAFVRLEGDTAYTELNFSPSGRWAAYSFDGHREGMRDFKGLSFDGADGEILLSMIARGGETDIRTWAFSTFDVLDGTSDWWLALTAIIEAKDGTKSYWALAHAPGPPDFHNADCFTARLPAPELP